MTYADKTVGKAKASYKISVRTGTIEINGSILVTVDRTAWGDIFLSLVRHDLHIQLDPADAARICADIWTALGRSEAAVKQSAA